VRHTGARAPAAYARHARGRHRTGEGIDVSVCVVPRDTWPVICTCKYNILVVASAMIEFAENDKLTVLPCAHEFHSACVETKSWGVPV